MDTPTTTVKNPLWTKDFTILTIGSIISKLGTTISGFAMGLLVLDYSGSTFLYALYLFMFSAPKVIVPVLAGPWLDKFSRRKAIYTLDFISTGIYIILAIVIAANQFSYVVLIAGCLILGTIDSIYNVAYESFYPMLIKEGNYTKAYSISSTLETLIMLMVPVSAALYRLVGIVPLFCFDAATYLIAAIFETQIKQKEAYTAAPNTKYRFQQYKSDFLEGANYIKKEKGLLAITLYFTVTMFTSGAFNTIVLPFFKENYQDGEFIYIYVMAFMMLGRLIGGTIHYKFKYPTDKKYAIAVFVYIAICILDGSFMYVSVPVMMVFCFLAGILGVTSYNIRISATQSYVEDGRKARFNGTFQMATMFGVLIGELLSGFLADILPQQYVLSAFEFINLIAVFLIMYRNRSHVKVVYNRQA